MFSTVIHAIAGTLAVAPLAAHALWPMPRSLQTGTTLLKLAPTFDIQVNVNQPPQDLLGAVGRTKVYIQTDKLQRLVLGRGANDSTGLQTARALPQLVISLSGDSPVRPVAIEAVQAHASRSEGYSLTVPSDGSAASITANSTLGLLRGLTTFEQLWYDAGGVTYTYQAPISIVNDIPAYPYRGFMLDTARNFFPVTDLKRTLDAMSWAKINTFHWHIVDSQSFPLSVAEFPELAAKGAYSQAETYSPADVQDVVSYAGSRGIDVLMEIDTPGHSAVIAESHPEHIACNQAKPWSSFAGEPPAGQLRMASAATTTFTANLISAVAKTLPSKLFSTGGDEVNTNCYANDAQTQTDLKNSGRTLEQALSVFVQTTHRSLTDLGKSPGVWEEMVLEHSLNLTKDTVVMVWISSQHAASVASKGFRIVHAPSDYFYLASEHLNRVGAVKLKLYSKDCGAGGWLGGGAGWCDPFKTWQKSYSFDPLLGLTATQGALVLGGEQLLWTEQSSPQNLDPIAWPRAASSAEVFWTGAKLPDGSPRDVALALPRLHDLRYRMVQRGVRAISLQPHWCAIRPGVCDASA